MKKRALQRRGFGMKLAGNGTGSGAPKPPPFYPLPSGGQSGTTSASANAAAAPGTVTCDQAITPGCISALYQVPPGTKAKRSNKMGIFEADDAYAQEDLNSFWANIYPAIPQGTGPELDSIDGGVAPVAQVNAGLESSLDFEVAYPLLWLQETILYQVGLTATFNSFFDALDGVS
jgi:tripeptidyl-peptidase-1